MYRLCIFLMPLLLVGCYAPGANPPHPAASEGSRAEVSLAAAGTPGANYQAPIAAYIKRYFVHPESLREVKIGAPFAGKLHDRAGSIVCVELNAMNNAGSYSGLKRTAFLVQDDKVLDSDYDTPICSNQQLAAWPEMEAASAPRTSRRGDAEGNGGRKQQSSK
jgi:hypothetical protein